MVTSILKFRPSSIVELDDPLTGKRRLVLVASNGTDFFDYVNEVMPNALPIMESLEPREWGDYLALAENIMLVEGNATKYYAFLDMMKLLCDTDLGGDALSLNRAAKWALDNSCFDIRKVVVAAKELNAEAIARQLNIKTNAEGLLSAGAENV